MKGCKLAGRSAYAKSRTLAYVLYIQRGALMLHSSQSLHVCTLQLLKHVAPYSFEWEKVMLRVDDKLHKIFDAAAQAYLMSSVAVVSERSAGRP
jgi:predicted HicB family RNase H-like nuclease|eukprot:8786-Heterococcus_DN1.PRE.5